jgi:hypothetical protein
MASGYPIIAKLLHDELLGFVVDSLDSPTWDARSIEQAQSILKVVAKLSPADDLQFRPSRRCLRQRKLMSPRHCGEDLLFLD